MFANSEICWIFNFTHIFHASCVLGYLEILQALAAIYLPRLANCWYWSYYAPKWIQLLKQVSSEALILSQMQMTASWKFFTGAAYIWGPHSHLSTPAKGHFLNFWNILFHWLALPFSLMWISSAHGDLFAAVGHSNHICGIRPPHQMFMCPQCSGITAKIRTLSIMLLSSKESQ